LKELVSALERRFPIDPVLSMGKMGIIRPCMIKKKYLFVYHGQPYWGFAAERDTGLSSFGVGSFFFFWHIWCAAIDTIQSHSPSSEPILLGKGSEMQ
jgi:hypothetical protein